MPSVPCIWPGTAQSLFDSFCCVRLGRAAVRRAYLAGGGRAGVPHSSGGGNLLPGERGHPLALRLGGLPRPEGRRPHPLCRAGRRAPCVCGAESPGGLADTFHPPPGRSGPAPGADGCRGGSPAVHGADSPPAGSGGGNVPPGSLLREGPLVHGLASHPDALG